MFQKPRLTSPAGYGSEPGLLGGHWGSDMLDSQLVQFTYTLYVIIGSFYLKFLQTAGYEIYI